METPSLTASTRTVLIMSPTVLYTHLLSVQGQKVSSAPEPSYHHHSLCAGGMDQPRSRSCPSQLKANCWRSVAALRLLYLPCFSVICSGLSLATELLNYAADPCKPASAPCTEPTSHAFLLELPAASYFPF